MASAGYDYVALGHITNTVNEGRTRTCSLSRVNRIKGFSDLVVDA